MSVYNYSFFFLIYSTKTVYFSEGGTVAALAFSKKN